MQRCGAHLASKSDVEEAFMAGTMAVRYAVAGETDNFVATSLTLTFASTGIYWPPNNRFDMYLFVAAY